MTNATEKLVPCPLCGASDGYALTDGDTYRWWLVLCKGCGEIVASCASDRRTQAGSVLPKRWPAADEAWNSAGAYANDLRLRAEALEAALRQVAQAHAWLAFGECRSFGADVPLLTPSDADAVARVALGEYSEGPTP